MIDTTIGTRCTACSCCANICPVNAISLFPDNKGFAYPTVDYSKCIKCKKCITHCPAITPLEPLTFNQPTVYAAWNKNEQLRLESTSGGIFSALAEAVLRRDGYVVGAEYGDRFQIHHTVIHSADDIVKQRQSKYAQSELGNVFGTIKKLLDQGALVLFCGTPCQSAGLQKYLTKYYENLYCCDFICRGVISQKVYQKFIADMHTDKHATLEQVHFKNKDFGWNKFSTKLTFSDGYIYQKDRNEDYYMRGYLKHNLYLRDCCHHCTYKSIPRVSDVSLGDFWGIGIFDPSLDNEKGTSVILINSDKGHRLFEWIQDAIIFSNRTLGEVLAGNSCLLESAPPGKYRDYFFKKMDHYRFSELIELIDKKSAKVSFPDNVLRLLSILKRKIIGNRK